MNTVDPEAPGQTAGPHDDAGRSGFPDMRRIVESHSLLLWVGSPDGTRRWVGDALAKFTGWAHALLAGPGWRAAIHPEDSSRCAAIDRHCLAADRTYALDYRLLSRDGAFVWMMDSAKPCYDDAGRFKGHVGVCVDIHARRLAEEQIAERMRRIRVAGRSVT